MKLEPTELPGVMRVRAAPQSDERGWFARTWDARLFAQAGIGFVPTQCNASYNRRRGSLRGLHYQRAPAGEPKLVRCVRGAVWDVAVDLRPESPTYCRWTAAELSADNLAALYIPAGCAHGYITLADDSELFYVMGAAYVPELATGVRWDDPAFGIAWPLAPAAMSPKDAAWPDFAP